MNAKFKLIFAHERQAWCCTRMDHENTRFGLRYTLYEHIIINGFREETLVASNLR